MSRLTGALLIVLAWPRLAAGAGAAEGTAAAAAGPSAALPTSPEAPPTAAGEAPTPLSPAAPAAPSRRGFSATAGWGYYEVSHVGVAYHVAETAAFELFGGLGFAGEGQKTSVGLGFSHALGGLIRTMEWGWDVKTIYWTQSDSNYDWKMFSMVLGGYLLRDLNPRLSLKLDAGVALTAALDSTRKQDIEFGHPQRWNGSVCLEAVYRFGGS
jgi:hypothetical protein